MRAARKVYSGVFIAGLAAAGATAHAQLQTSPFSAAPQVPQVQAPALQTPTITNPPAVVPAVAIPQKPAAAELPPKPAAQPTAERNEFQQFIEASTGQRLPIFGHQLFEATPSTFAPVENIPVPADYVIGPGDE